MFLEISSVRFSDQHQLIDHCDADENLSLRWEINLLLIILMNLGLQIACDVLFRTDFYIDTTIVRRTSGET